jgi:hypothetical protein
VFGVSSDEYLNYALQNRAEWESRGQEIVEEMKSKVLAGGAEESFPQESSGGPSKSGGARGVSRHVSDATFDGNPRHFLLNTT